MKQVIYCNICRNSCYIDPDYCLSSFPFKNSEGKKFDLFICRDCRANDKVVKCSGCHCYLRSEDIFSFHKAGLEKYCRQCVEQAIEDKLQEIENVKAKLKDAKAAFERRKAERNDKYETND